MKRRYYFLHFAKLLLGVFSIGALGVLFAFYQKTAVDEFAPEDKSILLTEKEGEASLVGKNQAMNPHFEAMDEKGQTYVIEALCAREGDREGMIALEEPHYKITLNNKTTVKAEAKEGILDQTAQKLILKGDVVVHYGHDYTVKTPLSHIDLREGYAEGQDSIQAHSEVMDLQAGTYRIEEKGDRIILEGSPILKIQMKE